MTAKASDLRVMLSPAKPQSTHTDSPSQYTTIPQPLIQPPPSSVLRRYAHIQHTLSKYRAVHARPCHRSSRPFLPTQTPAIWGRSLSGPPNGRLSRQVQYFRHAPPLRIQSSSTVKVTPSLYAHPRLQHAEQHTNPRGSPGPALLAPNLTRLHDLPSSFTSSPVSQRTIVHVRVLFLLP